MGALGRVELPTNGLGNRCSIHLSYRASGPDSIIARRITVRQPRAAWSRCPALLLTTRKVHCHGWVSLSRLACATQSNSPRSHGCHSTILRPVPGKEMPNRYTDSRPKEFDPTGFADTAVGHRAAPVG